MKRTACKKCRYLRCLKFGLNPDRVLNEEDRKKYTHPKKNVKKRKEKSQLQANYLLASEKVELNHIWIEALIDGHLNTWMNHHTFALFHVLRIYDKVVENFAVLMGNDQILSSTVQHVAPIFTQYILANYFNASNGKDQVTWILGSNLPFIGKMLLDNTTLYPI